MLTSRPVSFLDPIGTGSLGGLDPALAAAGKNKTWSLILNSVGATGPGRLRHTVTLAAAQCAVDGCVLAPTAVRPSVFSPWSSPSTWPGGVVPAAGDDVLIAGNMAVELDVSPPALGALRIDGALRFKDDGDKALHAGGWRVTLGFSVCPHPPSPTHARVGPDGVMPHGPFPLPSPHPQVPTSLPKRHHNIRSTALPRPTHTHNLATD
jgi:hypothetical protein